MATADEAAVVPESPPLAPAAKLDDHDMSDATLPSQRARSKFASPVPAPTSSITPPPSSQTLLQPPVKHVVRTPSPPASQLTSPPPTNRLFVQTAANAELPSSEQVDGASVEELRKMVENLSLALREARASAAHYKLQHRMLQIDSTEATNRMEVELQLTQREVDVLQAAEERRHKDYISPIQQAGTSALIEDLNRQCHILQDENELLRGSLARTLQTLEDTEDKLSSLREENGRLRHRIRTNRDHMNGILDSVSDGSPRSLFGTPRRTPHHATPRHAPPSRPVVAGREPGAFEALLLADKVLNSQEAATAPSTPKTMPHKQRAGPGHVRNTHSLGSLPTTPSRRPHLQNTVLQTPPNLTSIREPPSVGQQQVNPPQFHLPLPSQRRRASSDSTITASSVDETTKVTDGASDNEDAVPESQASQRAAQLLRSTPKSSKSGKSKMVQSRITGRITKPGFPNAGDGEKRRMTSFGSEIGSPSKRGKIGLGIGLPGAQQK